MRFFFTISILLTLRIGSLYAQNNSFELDFSLLHPVSKAQEMDYYYGLDYSVDPTLEVLYHFPFRSTVVISSGIYFQYGEHNWEELLRKPMQNPDGTWYPSRINWLRQLQFFSLGLPLQAELKTNGFLINSVFAGVTAGNHLRLTLKERMANSGSEYVEAESPNYRWLFWDVYAGVRKTVFRSAAFNIDVKPRVGYKSNQPGRTPGQSNYFFYGLGLSTTFEI